MTILRLHFGGFIKKVATRQVGIDTVIELQLCRKNRGGQVEAPSFTWVRVSVWKPAEFLIPRLVEGVYVCGDGDITLRSYEVQGAKKSSLECRCSSYEIDIADAPAGQGAPSPTPAPAPVRAPAPRAAAPADDDEPPF